MNHQMHMFTIRDSKAETYHPPFFKNTEGEATRDFQHLMNDPNSTINKFPEDFDLYYLGEYDSQTGKMKPLDTPRHIIKAANFHRAEIQKPLAQIEQ